MSFGGLGNCSSCWDDPDICSCHKKRFECKGKEEFDSKQEAMEHIWYMIEESYGGYVFVKPYKCKFCGKFHLTSVK